MMRSRLLGNETLLSIAIAVCIVCCVVSLCLFASISDSCVTCDVCKPEAELADSDSELTAWLQAARCAGMPVGQRVLMIVAHPDDEVLFGMPDLMFAQSLHVICLTNASNPQRAAEFRAVIEHLQQHVHVRESVVGTILDFPDGKRKIWRDLHALASSCVASIASRDVSMSGAFDVLVTHGADGEYGHVQHKATHRLCTDYVGPILNIPVATFEMRWSQHCYLRHPKPFSWPVAHGIKPRSRQWWNMWLSRERDIWLPATFWSHRRLLLNIYKNRPGTKRWELFLHCRTA
jgi:LmbE family N-acetylglucosaminyl deacetylase